MLTKGMLRDNNRPFRVDFSRSTALARELGGLSKDLGEIFPTTHLMEVFLHSRCMMFHAAVLCAAMDQFHS